MNTGKEGPKEPPEKNDAAFTPGGRRPRKNIHLYGTSQQEPPDLLAQSSADPLREVSRPEVQQSDRLNDGFVMPPGGRRRRSRVRRLEPGLSFSFGARSELPLRRRKSPGPPDTANWITSAGWSNSTGDPITLFTSSWTVPSPPPTVASQLLYLFNGIEPADGQTILQPVLQWGDSGADEDGQNRTGQFWAVASWMVGGPDNSATHTPHIQVTAGDVLVGAISLVSQSTAGFVYTCEFQGIAGTALSTPPIPELVWCVEALEAYELQDNYTPPYDLDSASEYPASQMVAFDNINIVTNAPGPPGSWQVANVVATFGEYSSIANDSSASGEIDVYFRSPSTVSTD
jgi:hypothetical protein